MIYDNNCLFLFNKDLSPELREIKELVPDTIDGLIKINLNMFMHKGQDKNFANYVHGSKAIMYVDVKKRMIIHMEGSWKGKVKKY